jgi:actin-related protein
VISSFDDWEEVCHHGFYNELRGLQPEEYPVLLTEKWWNPRAARQKTAEVLFESFNVPALHLVSDDVLAMYSAGCTSGLSVGSGDGGVQVTCVHSGTVVPHASIHVKHFGSGRYLTDLLHVGCGDVLKDMKAPVRGRSVPPNRLYEPGRELARMAKEAHLYIAQNVDEERHALSAIEYPLPDGRKLTLTDSRFLVPETLFKWKQAPTWEVVRELMIARTDHNSVLHTLPKDVFTLVMDFLHSNGLPQMIGQVLEQCGSLRPEVSPNIVLHGGNTAFAGLPDRLRGILPKACQLHAPPQRRDSVWLGGSILASMSSFEALLTSKQQYEELGKGVLYPM